MKKGRHKVGKNAAKKAARRLALEQIKEQDKTDRKVAVAETMMNINRGIPELPKKQAILPEPEPDITIIEKVAVEDPKDKKGLMESLMAKLDETNKKAITRLKEVEDNKEMGNWRRWYHITTQTVVKWVTSGSLWLIKKAIAFVEWCKKQLHTIDFFGRIKRAWEGFWTKVEEPQPEAAAA